MALEFLGLVKAGEKQKLCAVMREGPAEEGGRVTLMDGKALQVLWAQSTELARHVSPLYNLAEIENKRSCVKYTGGAEPNWDSLTL